MSTGPIKTYVFFFSMCNFTNYLKFQESTQSAAAAFLGSCNSIRDLTSRLLFIAPDQLHFPDEDAAAAMTFPFFGNVIAAAMTFLKGSQNNLQAFF